MEQFLGPLDGQTSAVQRRIGRQTVVGRLQTPHAGGDVLGQKLQKLPVQRILRQHLALPHPQHRQPRLEFRHADLGDHPGLETGTQPLVDVADLAGMAVAGQNDLLMLPVQRVEEVEELLLHLRLLGQTVDVVHQQHVHVAHRGTERRETALLHQQVVEVVQEFIAGGVANDQRGVAPPQLPGDGLQKMGLAHAVAAEEKERVVQPRLLGGRQSRRKRVTVFLAHDEVFKGELVGVGCETRPRRSRRFRFNDRLPGVRLPDVPRFKGERIIRTVDIGEELFKDVAVMLEDETAGEVVLHADDDSRILHTKRNHARHPVLIQVSVLRTALQPPGQRLPYQINFSIALHHQFHSPPKSQKTIRFPHVAKANRPADAGRRAEATPPTPLYILFYRLKSSNRQCRADRNGFRCRRHPRSLPPRRPRRLIPYPGRPACGAPPVNTFFTRFPP